MPFEEQLRDALIAYPGPRREIAKLSGIHEVSLSEFANGKKTLNVASAEALADALGLNIALIVKRKTKRRPKA